MMENTFSLSEYANTAEPIKCHWSVALYAIEFLQQRMNNNPQSIDPDTRRLSSINVYNRLELYNLTT